LLKNHELNGVREDHHAVKEDPYADQREVEWRDGGSSLLVGRHDIGKEVVTRHTRGVAPEL
jgi:hypothetical protein